MTQALFTSMTGLKAGTEQLTVVSDNVANMNTTAYKTSRVDFQDIWYQTRTTGTNSTRNMGGTNPYQIGVGVKCASITKDFGASSVNTTGRTEDMAIQGNGWFTVVNSDGAVLLTRDGTFALDENGYLCTASGCKVLGMDANASLTRSVVPIKMPTSVKVIENPTPKADFEGMYLDKLNGAQITSGTFKFAITQEDGTVLMLEADMGTFAQDTTDVNGLVTAIQNASVTGTSSKDGKDTEVTGKKFSEYVTVEVVDGALKFKPKNDTDSVIYQSGGTSNLVSQTNLANMPKADDGSVTSKILNKSAFITEVDDVTSDYTKSYKSFSVGKDGLVTVTYSDGSTLTVASNEDGTTFFQYIDDEGYIINDDIINSGEASLTVDPNVLVKANMQMQFAKVTNDSGLVAVGSNMYEIGVDCGQVIYSAANVNGVGEVATGALETSNVDLAQQFSNMILAQRLVQANSQVFSSANSMLETLVYLGR